MVPKIVTGDRLATVVKMARSILQRQQVKARTIAFISDIIALANRYGRLTEGQANRIEEIHGNMRSGALSTEYQASTQRGALRAQAASGLKFREKRNRLIEF